MLADMVNAYGLRQNESDSQNGNMANYATVCYQKRCDSSSTAAHTKCQNAKSHMCESDPDRNANVPYVHIYTNARSHLIYKLKAAHVFESAVRVTSKQVPFTHANGKNNTHRPWARCGISCARWAAIVSLSICLLLSAATGVQSQQQQQTTAASNTTQQQRQQSSSSNLAETMPTNASGHANDATHLGTSSTHAAKLDMESGAQLASRGVSMNRNSLIGGDNMLQRQLREKAKQDSLESIKMHILMRLNLNDKLPNITKPIAVPQTILENFYKTYNASLTGTHMWHRASAPSKTGPKTPDQALTASASAEAVGDTMERYHDHLTDSDNAELEENSSSDMQGDDANAFNEFKWISKVGLDGRENLRDIEPASDEEYESILSHINSIYVFPEQPHMRHNRKSDVLRFKFDSSYSDISYATLHLYLRGWDWISGHLPELYGELGEGGQQRDIVVAVHRAVRRANSTSFTHKAKVLEFRHKIPAGAGQWVTIDLKPLFGRAMDGPNKSQEILIKGVESWMKPLVVTTDNASKNPLTVHIEIGSQKKHRRKRSVYMDCMDSDQDSRCCRYPLKVNFTTFGWHFVVAPTSFDAYFCSGDCRVGYLEQYTHTHLTSLTTSASPCCSPTKMSSLSLLYFDYNQNLVLSVIPNMSVEGCSCS